MNQIQSSGKKTKLSLALFIGSIVAAILGATNLIVSIVMFKDNLDYYISMGYDSSEVMSQLFPTQLLPTLLEGIVLYFGIALLLLFASAAYQKLMTIDALNSIAMEPTASKENAAIPEKTESLIEETSCEEVTDTQDLEELIEDPVSDESL